LGDKPGAQIVDTTGFIAKIVSVDALNRVVTLQMADGTNRTIKVGPDINLVNVNPGDNVGVRVTRAIAIAVTAAP
jgi:preprotein translocase subunit YajC